MNVQQQRNLRPLKRKAHWVIAGLLLLLPLVAMHFIDEVAWDETDFLVLGAMLFGACGTYELAARTANKTYRAAVGVAVLEAVLLIWISLSVGIIGSEDNPANLMYAGVLVVGIVGGLIARFQPRGMAWALAVTEVARPGC
jgi:peptidoglycan/LPS O-acetylase OafA/YrhL